MRERVPCFKTAPCAPPWGCDSPNKLGSLEWEGPRRWAGSLPPSPAERRAGAGRSTGAPPPPARAPPRLLNALAAACARSITRPPASPTSERTVGPWGRARAASRSRSALGPPARPQAPARPFLRLGHGQPRRPHVHGAPRGMRGRARRGSGAAGATGRGPKRLDGRGGAAPPRGRAWGERGAAGPLAVRDFSRTSLD